MEQWLTRGLVRSICFGILFIPFVFYQLLGDGQLPDRPVAFDVGIVTVSSALGGLLLNAGVNLRGPKRKETIQVAQKFLAVVILTVISIPIMHFVEVLDITPPRSNPIAWKLGFEDSTFGLLQFHSTWPSFYSSLPSLTWRIRCVAWTAQSMNVGGTMRPHAGKLYVTQASVQTPAPSPTIPDSDRESIPRGGAAHPEQRRRVERGAAPHCQSITSPHPPPDFLNIIPSPFHCHSEAPRGI